MVSGRVRLSYLSLIAFLPLLLLYARRMFEKYPIFSPTPRCNGWLYPAHREGGRVRYSRLRSRSFFRKCCVNVPRR